nr:AP-1 complex subunit beta-1-like isoform X2 [Aotus nancymaae]
MSPGPAHSPIGGIGAGSWEHSGLLSPLASPVSHLDHGAAGRSPSPPHLAALLCSVSWASPHAHKDSDNPDLRDRGYIYWRLLSTDPVAAKEVVLAEKPLISEESDLIEPTLLDELICYVGTLASVYHKPPSAFVEGGRGIMHKSLPPRTASN